MVIFNLAVLGHGRPHRRHQRRRDDRREPRGARARRPADRAQTPNRRFVTAAAGRRRRRRARERRRRPPQRASASPSRSTALAGEVGFTLLAAPLLPRLGRDARRRLGELDRDRAAARPHQGRRPHADHEHAAAIAYLAVITTALAFVLWFGAVQQLGADKAGLLVGLMPIAAVVVDAGLNGRTPSPADVAGTALVAAGVVLGARPQKARARAGTRQRQRCPDRQRGPGDVGRRSDDGSPRTREASGVVEGERVT